ncbi:MAG: Rpn family recombination-promoting nuclease/putative transposase [Holosporales bacterium]|jgi:predicted transposase/invertase (TIGR01784 family)|nr:Rpn family recombination-promoting nuclease/putative transposase [Holosporales bacterium]
MDRWTCFERAIAMTALLDPKLDYIFKTIFGQEDRKSLLISFLNALFKGTPTIKDITLENTDIAKILEENKASRLDIKATSDDGTKLDIEIQCKNTGEIPQRAFHYLANMVPATVQEGKSYKGSNVIGIWILGENVTDRKNAISDAYMTFQENDPDPYQVMTNSARIIFIELPKFNPKNEDAKDMLTAWLSFLKDPVQMDGAFLDDQDVRKAMDTLMYISADKEVRAMADLRQKTINDYNSEMTVAREDGKAEGLAEGEAKGKKETASSMLAEGMSPEVVSRCTKLSIEDVLSLHEY